MFDVLFSRAAWSWIGGEISVLLIPLILLIASLIFDISKHLKAKQQRFSEQNNLKIAETTETFDDEHSSLIYPRDINIPEEDFGEYSYIDLKKFTIKIFSIILLLVLLGTYLSDFSVENDSLHRGPKCPRTKIVHNKDAEKKLTDSGIFDNLQYDFKFHIVDLPENVSEALKNNKLLEVKYDPDKKFVLFWDLYSGRIIPTCPNDKIILQAITTAKNRPDNAEYFSFSRLPSLDRTFELQLGEKPDFCSREGEDNKIYHAKLDLAVEICKDFCILDPQTNRVFYFGSVYVESVADLLQTLLDYLKFHNL